MEQKKYWFSDSYRRNLVDMHIADWDPVFLSEFSPEKYYDNLRRAHIQAPMIYLQSHVGNCYFPTKVGHFHEGLRGREDAVKKLVSLCYHGGMHPVGYYSLIYNTQEEDKHPDWRLQDADDGSTQRSRGGRYGLLCPNNPEYRAFLEAQIKEMADYFHEDGKLLIDGMFYDMTFWPGICRCEHCRKRYAAETGKKPEEMPIIVDWKNPDFVTFAHQREAWMGDFATFVTNTTYRIMPGITVEHNYASAIASDSILCGSTELVNDACDFTGGDLYGSLYNHSFTAKYYYGVTRNQPFEYMTCRCDRSLYAHTVSKTDEHLAVEILLTAAHHGASFVIDAIDPVGTLDSRVYDRLGRVFERQMVYEPYFHGEMVADVGVYYPASGRYNTRNQPFNTKNCSVNLTKTLIEENVPTAVLSNRTKNLSIYRMILAPAVAGLPKGRAEDLIRYVAEGGNLYFSGAEEPKLLEAFFGAACERFTEEKNVYLAPTSEGVPYFWEFTEKYPLPTDYSLPVIRLPENSKAVVYANITLPYTKPTEQRFASIHSNPPGIPTDIPAVLSVSYGKERVLWCAAPLELDDRYMHKTVLMNLMKTLLDTDTLSVRSNAPHQVELVTFRGEEELLLSAVDLFCTEELLPVPAFRVSVKCEKAPASVVCLAAWNKPEKAVDFSYENGYMTFTIDNLVMFDMYRIAF